MLQNVEVLESGDRAYLEGEQLDKMEVEEIKAEESINIIKPTPLSIIVSLIESSLKTNQKTAVLHCIYFVYLDLP